MTAVGPNIARLRRANLCPARCPECGRPFDVQAFDVWLQAHAWDCKVGAYVDRVRLIEDAAVADYRRMQAGVR